MGIKVEAWEWVGGAEEDEMGGNERDDWRRRMMRVYRP